MGANFIPDQASDIKTDTVPFSGNLSPSDDDVQKALETLDLVGGGGGSFNPDVDNLSASGNTVSLTAGENLSFGEVVYIKSDGKMWKADANAADTFPVTLMAAASISADASGNFLILGFARNDAWNWTVGGQLYLSTTAGAITQTMPTTTDDVIQHLGIATHANRIYFNPSQDFMTADLTASGDVSGLTQSQVLARGLGA
jgi:hypothetical protein